MDETTMVAVDEFTDIGELVPADPVEWRDGEDAPAGFELVGKIGQFETVDVEVFLETGGRVLVHGGVCGVPIAVMCASRARFLKFAREWLGPLARLNRSNAGDEFKESLSESLAEISKTLAAVAAELVRARSAPRVEPTAPGQAADADGVN